MKVYAIPSLIAVCFIFGCNDVDSSKNGATKSTSRPGVNNAAVRSGHSTSPKRNGNASMLPNEVGLVIGGASEEGNETATDAVELRPIDPTYTDLPLVTLGTVKGNVSSDNYTIRALIGTGSAGQVHWVERESDNQSFALKQCRVNQASRNEVYAYNLLKGKSGFPQILESWEESNTTMNILITRLGSRIEDIRTVAGGKLATMFVPTVGSIALQLIDRIETIHSLGIVHGDLFPNNMAVGLGNESSLLFVFDFGESLRYIDPVTAEQLTNIRKTRLFDIQSLSHTVLQLLRPGTPYGDYKHWADHSTKPSLDELCEGLPSGVRDLFGYSHEELDLHDAPDYEKLRKYMATLAPHYDGRILWDAKNNLTTPH